MFGAPIQIVRVTSTLFEIIKTNCFLMSNLKTIKIFYVGFDGRNKWRGISGEEEVL
jgi:hypothetical protein